MQDYTASRTNSALDGQGNLAITALRQDVAGATYTSARLNTQDTFTFGYSHVAAVMRLPAGSGMWPAFWALGANQPQVNWPSCGEIDVLEGLGANPADVSGHIHSLGNGGDPIGYLNQPIASLSGLDFTRGHHAGLPYLCRGLVAGVDHVHLRRPPVLRRSS